MLVKIRLKGLVPLQRPTSDWPGGWEGGRNDVILVPEEQHKEGIGYFVLLVLGR